MAARATHQTRDSSRPRARTNEAGPSRASRPDRRAPEDSDSRWNVTVTSRSTFSWCGFFVTTAVVIGTALGIRWLAQGPRRVAVVHTETRGGWTARVVRSGPWSEETSSWVGRSSFEIEIVDPDSSVYRIKTNIGDEDRALQRMRHELAARVGEGLLS